MERPELQQVREYGELVNDALFQEDVETAYHGLAMAMHAAQSAVDIESLTRIGATADKQARILAERAQALPPDGLQALATASHARIFASLGQQSRTVALRLAIPSRPRG